MKTVENLPCDQEEDGDDKARDPEWRDILRHTIREAGGYGVETRQMEKAAEILGADVRGELYKLWAKRLRIRPGEAMMQRGAHFRFAPYGISDKHCEYCGVEQQCRIELEIIMQSTWIPPLPLCGLCAVKLREIADQEVEARIKPHERWGNASITGLSVFQLRKNIKDWRRALAYENRK